MLGKFLTKTPPLTQIVKVAVMRMWRRSSLSAVVDLENGFYLFRLTSMEEATGILTGNPWTVLGEALSLQS